jgi:hypothetical protein
MSTPVSLAKNLNILRNDHLNHDVARETAKNQGIAQLLSEVVREGGSYWLNRQAVQLKFYQ